MSLTRYLAVSTAIVVVFIGIVATLRGHGKDLQVRGGAHPPSSMTPTPSRREGGTGAAGTPPPADADAPWALSALPGCYRQLLSQRGRDADVERALPPVALTIAPGSTLTTGPCTIDAGATALTVRRGDDVLRVGDVRRRYVAVRPPLGDLLVVLRGTGAREELRVYRFCVPTVLRRAGFAPVSLASDLSADDPVPYPVITPRPLSL